MRKNVRKDLSFRKGYSVYEDCKLILSSALANSMLLNSVRDNLFNQQLGFPRSSFSTNSGLRCIFTGRRKRLNKWYCFSRLVVLRLFRLRKLIELKKSKW